MTILNQYQRSQKEPLFLTSFEGNIIIDFTCYLAIGENITESDEFTCIVTFEQVLQSAEALDEIAGVKAGKVEMYLNYEGDTRLEEQSDWWNNISTEAQEAIIVHAVKEGIFNALSINWISIIENKGVASISKYDFISQQLALSVLEDWTKNQIMMLKGAQFLGGIKDKPFRDAFHRSVAA